MVMAMMAVNMVVVMAMMTYHYQLYVLIEMTVVVKVVIYCIAM